MRTAASVAVILGLCALATASSPMPTMVHLAYGGGSDMVVSFTVPSTTDVSNFNALVMWGDSASNVSTVVPATSAPLQEKCYTASPYTYHITLSGLDYQTQYFYKCGSTAGNFTDVFNFTTKLEPGTEGVVDFVWYGDMGVSNSEYTQAAVSKLIGGDGKIFLLHIGDISYADDRIKDLPGGILYQPLLNEFYNQIQPYAAHTAMMTTPGNHEWPCSQGEYLNRLMMPYKQSNSPEPQYYSFRYGRVHFQMMSTEAEQSKNHIAVGSPAYNWMKADLAQASADKTAGKIDWILVFAHRPLYCSWDWGACCWDNCHNSSSYSWNNLYRDNVEPLLLEYQVDLWMNGHTHNWERTTPIAHNNVVMNAESTDSMYVNPGAPVYVTNGAPGDTEVLGPNWLQTPAWSVSRITTVQGFNDAANTGYSRVTAHNGTALEVQFVRGSDSKVMDHFWISRQN